MNSPTASTAPAVQDPVFPAPELIVSQCLGFEAVRYNAQIIRNDFVHRLARFCSVTTVCPEVAIGLGVPRPPIRLVQEDSRAAEIRVVQPQTGRDVTAEMSAFADTYLRAQHDIDGFVLKNRSPSCGIGDVKVYSADDADTPARKGAGAFGGAVVDRFPDAAIEDEGRLRSDALRERFLTLLFALARLRNVEQSKDRAALVSFHASYKYTLLAYEENGMRELGRVVASVSQRPWQETIALYRARFAYALRKPAKLRAHVNALTHAFGHLSDGLSSPERQFFLEQLDELRAGRLPLSGALTLLRSWVLRFDVPYLAAQAYFRPYPVELQ